MIIGGIDLGVRKASVAIFNNGELTHVDHLELSPLPRARELQTLAQWTFGYTKACDVVLVEEPLAGRNTRVSLRIAQTAGAVMATMGGILPIKSDFIDNKTWKKAIVGNGNASKEMIAMWLKSSHPSYSVACGDNQDRVDAVCIGLYGVQLVERSGQLAEL